MIIKSSKEESVFVKELIEAFKYINMSDLSNVKRLENVVLNFANLMERIWVKDLKSVNITKHYKSWWDINCSRDLKKYRLTKSIEDWKQFKKTIRNTKCSYFDFKI